MCSKQGKPSVPVHLTLMPSSSVGRNSDPFLGLPAPLLVLLEHSTSAWHKRQPKKLPPKNCFEIQWVRNSSDTLVFEGKSNSQWRLTAVNIPTSKPNRMCIGRLSSLPSCSLINWRNRLDSFASHATRHAEHMGHRKCWCKIRETLRLQICGEVKQGWTRLNTDTKTKQESCYSGRVVMKTIQVQMQ